MHLQMLLSKMPTFYATTQISGWNNSMPDFNKPGPDLYRSKGGTHILSNGKTAPDGYRWLCLDFISSQDIGSTPIANVQETKKQSEETLDDKSR